MRQKIFGSNQLNLFKAPANAKVYIFLPCLLIKVGALFKYTVKLKVIPQ